MNLMNLVNLMDESYTYVKKSVGSIPSGLPEKGIINVGLFDDQFVFCISKSVESKCIKQLYD